MMEEFFTPVKTCPSDTPLAHGMKVWTVGSCFSDKIGRRMAAELFDVRVNPLGILFNPLSICNSLTRVLSGEPYNMADLCRSTDGELWHCMDFHSSFSGHDAEVVLDSINTVVSTLHSELPALDTLMVTLGSARAFIDNDSGRVVANCHKFPASRFTLRDYNSHEIAEAFTTLLTKLHAVNPRLRVIFTVSPVRHKAYGMHADKLSKAHLLLAVDTITRPTGADSLPITEYFPAYEIMTDELREYRFYASDMIHPSEVAASHIYSRFADTYYSTATKALATECLKLTRRLNHRPLHTVIPSATRSDAPPSASYLRFRDATMAEAHRLLSTNPQLHCALNRIFIENDLHI